jgi:hypothetical protein
MSRPVTRFPRPTINRCLAGVLLLAVLSQSSVAYAADTTPANGYADPASACTARGGKYLGDLKCQHTDGSIAPILFGAEAQRAMMSSTPVTRKSPHACALATTAIIFEYNGHRHDLLSGTVATAGGQESGKHLLSEAWSVNNHDELLGMLSWLQFQGHRSEFDELGRRVDALDNGLEGSDATTD